MDGRVTNTVGSWFDIRNIVIPLNTVDYNKCVVFSKMNDSLSISPLTKPFSNMFQVICVIQEKCSKALSSSEKWLSVNKPIKRVLKNKDFCVKSTYCKLWDLSLKLCVIY